MRPARLTSRADRLSVVLVAHGSRDPRAAAATSALARAVRRVQPRWEVHASYLDHAGPRPLAVLGSLSSRRAVLVPLLLTNAYHGRVDIPAVLEEAADLPVSVTLASVLGPAGTWAGVSPLLIDGLVRRLPARGLDGVVLAAAGTRDAAARETVDAVAGALSVRLGLPCAVGYVSGPGVRPGAAVDLLRRSGAGRVGVAAYFLAPGYLYDLAAREALGAGAVVVAEPLTDAPEVARLVAARVEAAVVRPLAAA
ncbi:sirohydrochlorin chelatase [Paractinoplanes rishiriensis]|uniref:Cobalamin biosynthesis protein n=1 Tax=Paractinoplanes rishiriensis TaxID=1050105 RepID=A0A919MSS2_9ACTN|nr:CbiX/SirB N-terminal domain-containing protein [Actinoplanes rishiriensis]GIE94013.1 cobalamin biosynthesis protein [Actinoplanes rishiriensis]